MRRHRRRVPPGRDPHHAVRRGAPPGARGDGRRHVQRARGRGRGQGREGRGRIVGLGLRPGRRVPDDRAPPPVRQPHALRRGQDVQRGSAPQLHTTCTASTTCALRYFNVYGPRMDIHGVYTEVLVRWMERIAAGQPPLILGDGTPDDGLRVRRRHRPGQRARRRRPTPPTRCSTSPRHRDEPARSRHALLRRHGLRPRARVRPRAHGEPGVSAGSPTRPRPRAARLHGRGRSRRGPAPASSTGGGPSASPSGSRPTWIEAAVVTAMSEPSRSANGPFPVMRPWLGAEEAEAAATRCSSGWVAQGPRVAEFERGVRGRGRRRPRASPCRRARPRCTSRSSSPASARATRSSSRRSRSSPPPTPCATSVPPRCSPTSTRPTRQPHRRRRSRRCSRRRPRR